MLAVTLTVTPLYAVFGCIGLFILSFVMTVRASARCPSSEGRWTLGMLVSLCGILGCGVWTSNHYEQEGINSMGQWTTLYRLVEDQHPVVQSMAIAGFLKDASNSEQMMSGDDFTLLMGVTNGIGADDLIGFVAAPEKEEK